MDFNQGFAIMHDRCVCTPPSGRNDCSQVQTARDTPIILTLLRAAVWMCLHDASCGLIVRDAAGQALGYFNFDEEPGRRSAAKRMSGMLGASLSCRRSGKAPLGKASLPAVLGKTRRTE